MGKVNKKISSLNLNNEAELKKPETFEKLHGKPVTRRDFLASGLIPFSASLFMPNWLNILAKSGVAEAQELVCKTGAVSDLCPFIGIKLSGGAAMSSNFLPTDQGGLLLKSYSLMGMGNGSQIPTTREFGNNALFFANSQMLAGIRAQAQANTLMKSSFVGVCVRSQDDNSMNKFDITGLVAKSGLSGKILPNLGRSNTETGANNSYAYLRPSAPLIVGRFEDVQGSLGVSGALASLNQTQKSSLFRSIASLSSSQAQNLSQYNYGNTLSQLVQCANQDNNKLISNVSSLNIDPLSNPAFSQVWGINNQTAKNSQAYVFATMVYNALNGNAGTINLEIGGFDYHNGTRASGEQKDLEAGTVIGRVLQSLAVMGKKGFIVVTSDGGVSSPNSESLTAPWSSDRGTSGAAYMIGYDPIAAQKTLSTQLGHFTQAQVADDNFLTGGSVEMAAGAMFANYLAFNGKTHLIESFLPRVFSSDQIELVTKFTGAA